MGHDFVDERNTLEEPEVRSNCLILAAASGVESGGL